MAIIECGYYALAKKKSIGSPVCERSSHKVFTPTGGGIVFVVATLLFGYLQFQHLTTEWIVMLGCALALGLVSFVDDIHPLPAKQRLFIQIAAVAIMFKTYLSHGSIDLFLLYLFCGVGCINSFNFIDGICGILAIYCAIVIGSLIYAFNIYAPLEAPLYTSLGVLLLIGTVCFAVFNLTNRMFSGDVGAIMLGLFIVWMQFNLIYITHDFTFVLLTIVCIFDTGFTALQRLFNRENILKPHRKHIYQVLANNWGMPHLAVSIAYGLIQIAISVIYFVIPTQFHATYMIIILATLAVLYFAIRKSAKSGKFQG